METLINRPIYVTGADIVEPKNPISKQLSIVCGPFARVSRDLYMYFGSKRDMREAVDFLSDLRKLKPDEEFAPGVDVDLGSYRSLGNLVIPKGNIGIWGLFKRGKYG